MPGSPVIGWDVGGAHLKAARLGSGGTLEAVVQRPCALWQGLSLLDGAIDAVLAELGAAPCHAITMTGEMVDLFPDRQAGVAALVAALGQRLGGSEIRYYAGREGFVDAARAAASPARVASANWLASAAVVAARLGTALLLDIGSTTTDVIPVAGGRIMARGEDDFARLVAGELVYTGVARTPLMSFAPRVPFGGVSVPLMAEYFATAADIHRLCGTLPKGADQHPAADGGEKTREGSARRLARMIGRDMESAPLGAWEELARWLVTLQRQRIDEACGRVIGQSGVRADAPLVGAGVGRFLVPALRCAAGREVVDFGALLPADPAAMSAVADCAPAASVAWLLGAASA